MILLSRPSRICDNEIEVEVERHFEMSDGRAHDKWVPVTKTWRVEERSAIWRVAANILNIQSQTAD